jgi:signal transduction histidine kinase/ActR/RegA family two-component response regulator
MTTSSFRVARHLRKTLADQLKPCFLLLDRGFRVHRVDGDAEYYGYGGLRAGQDCRDEMPFLFGLGAGEAIHLPLVETASGRAADVLLSPVIDGQGLLFIDAGRERAARQAAQQQANELRLLNERQRMFIEQLRSARDDLADKHRLAREASQVKSRFISGISHEFRTPLTGILSHLDLLRDRQQPLEAVQDSLTLIEANANHLLSLVDNVLDQASLELGQLALHPVPTRLADFCREMKVMFTPLAKRGGLQFDVRRRGSLPEWVRLDHTRLRQVVINLVGNGIKYTDSGYVLLSMAWTDNRLQVNVSDTGPGIPYSARERIFLAFHREEGTESTQGTGLGLAISSQLVEIMGGSLRLKDRPGGGSIFGFSVPAPEIARAGTDAGEQGAGHRILLVDDSRDICTLYSRVLQKAGFQVGVASDEPQAWDLFERQRPDVVLADLYLKEWDGAGLIRRLRGRGFGGGIVTWSASSSREDQQRALEAGADSYLVKPVEPPVLTAAIGQALRREPA